MSTLTIYRGSWARGPETPNMLFHPERRDLCCLGFDALARGCTLAQITDRTGPRSVTAPPPAYAAHYRHALPCRIDEAMRANDAPYIAHRESAVRLALVGLGWDDVLFVDGMLPILATGDKS